MLVYGAKQPKKEHMDLYHGIHRKAAADVPPSSDKIKHTNEEYSKADTSKRKLFGAVTLRITAYVEY